MVVSFVRNFDCPQSRVGYLSLVHVFCRFPTSGLETNTGALDQGCSIFRTHRLVQGDHRYCTRNNYTGALSSLLVTQQLYSQFVITGIRVDNYWHNNKPPLHHHRYYCRAVQFKTLIRSKFAVLYVCLSSSSTFLLGLKAITKSRMKVINNAACREKPKNPFPLDANMTNVRYSLPFPCDW